MICCLVSDAAPAGALDAVARACSPRVASYDDTVAVFDASGLSGMFGTPEDLVREVVRLGADRHLTIRVALAHTMTTAWIVAHARAGASVVPIGREAERLAAIPIRYLAMLPEMAIEPDARLGRRRARARHYRMAPGPELETNLKLKTSNLELKTSSSEFSSGASALSSKFKVLSSKLVLATIERWGVHTLGDVARLPRADLHARLGPIGVRLHQAACGEDVQPLVPAGEPVTWIERMACEWPIDGLEPLSFVLSRVCEALAARLERADRGAVDVTTRLQLVTRTTHARTLHLPSPMRDARGLRTLMLLDLESHPPPAAIDVVEVELGVAPGRIVHGSLLERAVPAPDDLATLTARLGALMGESRIGAASLVDTHDARAVAMQAFHVTETRQKAEGDERQKAKGRRQKQQDEVRTAPFLPSALCLLPSASCLLPCLRRFRLPIAARVVEDHHAPVRVHASARGIAGGDVIACAGPWRSSGAWWSLDHAGWDRDEWDVQLADGGVYRLARDRASGRWEIEGVLD